MHTQKMNIAEFSAGGLTGDGEDRRSFLGLFCSLGAAFAGAVCSVPLLRYVAYPLAGGSDNHNNQWADIGAAGEFAVSSKPVRKLINIERVDGWQRSATAQAVYVTRDSSGSLSVLSSVCPHLGCSVAWKPESDKFVCPCHGGCFAADGQRLSGPPPGNMKALAVRIQGERVLVNYGELAGKSEPA